MPNMMMVNAIKNSELCNGKTRRRENNFLEVMQQTRAPVATFQKCTEAEPEDEGQVEGIKMFIRPY